RQRDKVSYWEIPGLRCTGECKVFDVRTIAFAPRSDQVGIGVGSPNAIRLADIRSGRESDSIGEGFDCINSLLIMPDGKIVAGGLARKLSDSRKTSDFALARYSPDGKLDRQNNRHQVVRTDFFGDADEVRALASDDEGRIFAAGYATAVGRGREIA